MLTSAVPLYNRVTILLSVHPISIPNKICTPAGILELHFLVLMWFSSQIIVSESFCHQQIKEIRRET
jgi:membrane protein YqaA with SNARE-associated domain